MRRDEAAQMVQDYAGRVSPVMVSEYGDRLERESIQALGERMMGAASKYEVDENTQSFELSDIDTMLIGLREELLDVVNYCAMIDKLAERQGQGEMSDVRFKLRRAAGSALRNAVELEMTRRLQPEHQPATDYVTLLSRQTGMDHA